MDTCSSKPTPYNDKTKLHGPIEEDEPMPYVTKTYQQLVGGIRYIADSTRPDIYFVANRLSVAAKNPATRHWNALERLIRYLKHTQTYGLVFKAGRHKWQHQDIRNLLETYSDADFATDVTDRKSISGMIHLYNGTPICWGSLKQSITALSKCEAEYIAATSAAQQTTWIRGMLNDIDMLPPKATPFHIDTQSAIRVAKNSGRTKRGKFIDHRHHYLSHQTRANAISIRHIP